MEIIIDLRRKLEEDIPGTADTPIKKAGDVLAVKPDGAPWGREERRLFLIAKVEEGEFPEIEQTLIALRVRGYNPPQLSYPFAKHETTQLVDDLFVRDIVNQSTLRVDLSLFEGSPGLDPTDETAEPVLTNEGRALVKSDFIEDTSNRTA